VPFVRDWCLSRTHSSELADKLAEHMYVAMGRVDREAGEAWLPRNRGGDWLITYLEGQLCLYSVNLGWNQMMLYSPRQVMATEITVPRL